MTIDVLDADQVEFEMTGGSQGVAMRIVSYLFRWVSIGALIHVGWKLVG